MIVKNKLLSSLKNKMLFIFFASLSYLMGSLSCAVLFSRWMGFPDPRTQGSRNPGASNVLRLGHQKLAIFVLSGDSLKSIIPLSIAKAQGLNDSQLAWLVFVACMGHMFPLFFHLKGGKGIATAFGGLLVVTWPNALLGIGSWIGTFMLSGYASIASLLAIITVLISTALFSSVSLHTPIALLAGLLIARHSSNWSRLWKGTESSIKPFNDL